MKDNYVKALQKDKQLTDNYYKKSFTVKTEQQKILENILSKRNLNPTKIADIACSGGSLSFHLSNLYKADFVLSDLNQDGLDIAKNNLKKITTSQFKYVQDSIYELTHLKDDTFDLTFCWQTLSWLDNPEKALEQLVRITKKGGYLYLSSLFNIEHDVDVYSKVYDNTRESSLEASFNYNTYSKKTITHWLNKLNVESFTLTPFNPSIDFTYEGKGIGTYTKQIEGEQRLQLSAGMLLNWAILEIKK